MENIRTKLTKLSLNLTLALMALAFTACSNGNGGDNTPPGPKTVAVTRVWFNETQMALPVGSSVTITATVWPYNATNQTLSWTSSDEGVATVADGAVTAVSQGDATITATTQDGDKTATCLVEVYPADPYDTEFALRDALLEVWLEIGGRELTPQQQYEYGQRMEKAFIDGFARDSYAKHLPFDSKVLEKVFTQVDFRLPYTGGNQSDKRTYAQIQTKCQDNFHNALSNTSTTLHEVGHCLGLGEALTEVFTFKFLGRDLKDLSDTSTAFVESLVYSPFYPNFLLNKVGDTAFWSKVYERSNKSYGEMWDANMTVLEGDNVRRPLVSHNLMELGRTVISSTHGLQFREFLSVFAGISNWETHLRELAPCWQRALLINDLAAAEVREFFDLVTQFAKTYNITGTVDSILENARIFDYFKTNPKAQAQTADVER